MATTKSKLLAIDDTGFTTEDTAINIAVLANDLNLGAPKILYSLAQSGTAVVTKATSKLGASITMNANGTVNYDPSNDPTLQALAQGETATDTFTYTMKEANSLFTATVTVKLTGVNDAPVITGTVANQSTTNLGPISPFSKVAITDVDNGAKDGVTIKLLDGIGVATDANGTLSGSGLFKIGPGTYTFAPTTPTALSTELDRVVFTPTVNQGPAGSTVTTKFSLTASDGIATTQDIKTSVVTTQTKIIGYSTTLIDIPNPSTIRILDAADINDSGEVVGDYDNSPNSTVFIDASYTLIDGILNVVSVPGARDTTITAVNNAGHLAGDWDGTDFVRRNFFEHDGIFTTLPTDKATVVGLNNKDVVIGNIFEDGPKPNTGFAYDAATGNLTIIAHGTDPTTVFDINDDGIIVGGYTTTETGQTVGHGFIYDHGHFEDFVIGGAQSLAITAINNHSHLAGEVLEPDGFKGFLFDGVGVSIFDIPIVRDMNDNDVVVGNTINDSRSLVYGGALTNNQVLDITPNGTTVGGNRATSINNSNVVAGGASFGSGTTLTEKGFFATPITF